MSTSSSGDPLAQYRETVIHLFLHDRMLREQLRVILDTLGFETVHLHDVNPNYSQSAQQLAQLLIKEKREKSLFLIGPNLEVVGEGGKIKMRKELADFLRVIAMLLRKVRRDPLDYLCNCVPVFEDIQFVQKRENLLVSLAEHGISGAFILKKQESLVGLSTSMRKQLFQEQIMERFAEIKEYMLDYFPSREGKLELIKERQEEKELAERKTEAEKWMRKAAQCREAGDLEKSIGCYRKAISLYPTEPEAFLESGRIYVRLRKYPHALKYFRHAEDIAESLPEPNKEIANVRILQVKGRIERGDSPDSPEVMALLEEAAENYSSSLEKASKMDSRVSEEADGRSRDSMAKIAGEIFKHELDEVLGRNHPMLSKLGAIAGEALKDMGGRSMTDLPPQQCIFMGLAAANQGNFAEAEMYLFNALEDDGFFVQACEEITFLGTRVRKLDSSDKAVALYRRLLLRNPPNRAAVHYNMALALVLDDQEVEAAGHLVQAVYLNPKLGNIDEFYVNTQLFPVIIRLLRTLDTIVEKRQEMEVDKSTAILLKLQEDIEFAIMDDDEQTANQLLFKAVAKVKPFFQRRQPYASSTIMNYIDLKTKTLLKSRKESLVAFGKALVAISQRAAKFTPSEDYLDYIDYKVQALHVLGTTGDQAEASNHLGKALAAYPDACEDIDYYANQTLVNFGVEIHMKMSSIDRERIDFTPQD